jgi:hypothetical protein
LATVHPYIFFTFSHILNAVIGDFLPIPALAFLKSMVLDAMDIIIFPSNAYDLSQRLQ